MLGVDDSAEGIDVRAAVQKLRRELLSAASDGADEAIRFSVEQVELELLVQMQRDSRTRGGLKVWVVDAAAEQGAVQGHTHRVTLTLKPRHAVAGAPVDIGNPGTADLSDF